MEIMNQEMSKGYLKIYLGPMFAGKTSAIVQNYRRYTRAGKNVLVINHSLDVRYSETCLSTHDGIEIPCKFTDKLETFNNHIINNIDVVLINEGQFFPDLINYVLSWVEKHKKVVYVCGLDGDSERNPFGEILRLIPYADDYEKLTSICEKCGMPAPFTFRDPENSNGETIQIGNSIFKPMCRICYVNSTTNQIN